MSFNFIDIYFREGLYPWPYEQNLVLGSEGAGEIEAIGQNVENFKVGDRVAYAQANNAYSTHRVINENLVVSIPDSISYDIAASAILKGLTVKYLVLDSFKLEPHHKVLFHAAAGGVGLILSQWAKHIGATVIGTVGTEEKAEYAKKNGCDYTILYSKQDFSNKVKELTEGRGVNVIYDAIGKDTFNKGLTCLAERGRIVCYGFASGPIEPVDISQIRSFSGSIATGALLTYTKNHIERQKNADQLFNLINKAVLKININQKYSLEDAEVAHRELAGRKTIGSSVLIP